MAAQLLVLEGKADGYLSKKHFEWYGVRFTACSK